MPWASTVQSTATPPSALSTSRLATSSPPEAATGAPREGHARADGGAVAEGVPARPDAPRAAPVGADRPERHARDHLEGAVRPERGRRRDRQLAAEAGPLPEGLAGGGL